MTEIIQKYSSIYDVADRIAKYYGDKKDLVEFDAGTVGKDLRDRWYDLCQFLELPFRVTVCQCEEPEYVVILSDFTLYEGVSTEVIDGKYRKEYVEIRKMTLDQHTFVWVGKNETGGTCTFCEIYQDKYYTRIDRKLELRGMKKRQMRIVPILWVIGSDGQYERYEDRIRASLDRRVPESKDIAMVRSILDATLTEEVLMIDELLVQEIAKLQKFIKNKGKIDDARNKAIVAQALEDLRMTGKLTDAGFVNRFVNIISTNAVKFISFICLIYIIGAIIVNIISAFSGAPVPWVFPNWGGTPQPAPGEGTSPTPITEPVTTPAMLLYGLLLFLGGLF